MTPNQITCIRIALLPFIAFFYLADFIPWGKFIAVVLFAVAALTDFIDGKLARKTGQVTDLGKFLDTIADKLLITVALILVVADGT
ncbi:MAG: CDP-alcohol phosphatidyltransferase family protein, partial [Clostridia bacterium]|nr:CDP-alcohol phosphatidyltransferase family protein [Clostridia bacterium]